MARWLADTVPDRHYKCAWVTVVGLYMVPALFFAYRSWKILHDGVPTLQTSMSATWGTLPVLGLCSTHNHSIHIEKCHFMGFAPVTPFHASGASGAKVSSPCTMHGYSKEDMHSLAHVIRLPHAVHKLGKCLVINAAALQAQVPSTVAITARIYNETSEPLLLMTGLPPRLLTGISPGTTFLRLQKKATGAKTFRDNPDFKNLSWYSPSLYPKAFALMFMSPKMKDVYSSQVEFQYQDEDIEDPLGRFFKGHKNVSKKFKKILANTRFQRYTMDLKIDSGHVLEEVEIGRYPQLAWLLSGIGGYMSVISCVLGVCWVQRYPKSKEVVTCEAKTFVLASAGEEAQME